MSAQARRHLSVVAEVTGLFDLAGWPPGMRLMMRTERPHPGAQLRITDVEGHADHRVRGAAQERDVPPATGHPAGAGAAAVGCGGAVGWEPRGHRGRRSTDPDVGDRAGRSARPKVTGLPEAFRFHDLRHHLASLLIGSGLDVEVVQHRLRHGSARTTPDTYGHSGRTATSPHGPPLLLCWRPVGTRRGLLAPLRSGCPVQRRVELRCRSTSRTRAGAGAAGSG
jgi:hypothetical protein